MSEIRKGFSWGSLLSFIGLVAIVAYLAWQSTSKEDTQNYTKGATHNETTVTIAPVENQYPLAFPRCGRTFDIDSSLLQPKQEPKGKK